MSTVSTSQSIEWFHEGQARVVTIGDVEVTVRLVGRKGRRARIAIMAPAGATFDAREPSDEIANEPE